MQKAIHEALPASSLDTAIGWLIDRDAKKREAAVSILTSLGKPAVLLLINEVDKPKRQPKHSIAILDVIQRIGGPLEPKEMFALQFLLRHRNPAVCEKVARVIMSMSPGGIPDSPQGIALMRAFNPFLQSPPRCRKRRTRLSDIQAASRGDWDAVRRRARYNAARRKEEEREFRKRT